MISENKNTRYILDVKDEEFHLIAEDYRNGLTKDEIVDKYNVFFGEIDLISLLWRLDLNIKCPECNNKLFLKFSHGDHKIFCLCGYEYRDKEYTENQIEGDLNTIEKGLVNNYC